MDWSAIMPRPRACAQRHRLATLASGLIEPGWRNWQTRRSQKPLGASPWGFDSPSRHHFKASRGPDSPAEPATAAAGRLLKRHVGRSEMRRRKRLLLIALGIA